MTKLRIAYSVALVVVVVALVGFFLASATPTAAAPTAQQYAPRSVEFYPATAVTTGTTYSSAPITVNDIDFARVTNYEYADVFVSTGANSSGTTTITAQGSPDESSFYDLTRIVDVVDASGVLTETEVAYDIVLTDDDSGYFRVPLAGEFLRFKVVAAGTVTPTISVSMVPR